MATECADVPCHSASSSTDELGDRFRACLVGEERAEGRRNAYAGSWGTSTYGCTVRERELDGLGPSETSREAKEVEAVDAVSMALPLPFLLQDILRGGDSDSGDKSTGDGRKSGSFSSIVKR